MTDGIVMGPVLDDDEKLTYCELTIQIPVSREVPLLIPLAALIEDALKDSDV